VPRSLTVGYLLGQLQDLDLDLQVRLAINPDWPFAHLVSETLVISDGHVYIAEDGQNGYLPADVRKALAWA
jgi:hypothetical protein